MEATIPPKTRPVAVEKKRRSRQRRQRLQGMILPIKRRIPEHFSRTGDSEQIAEGYGVVRADVIDRALHMLYRRVEYLEAWRLLGCNEPTAKKTMQSDTRLQVVASREEAA